MTAPAMRRPVLESHVALRDGSVAHIRPIRAADEQRLLALLRGLSDDDRRLRFFSLGIDLSRMARDEAGVDNVHSLGLLATILLGQLADAAAANGIDTFEAIVLPEN